VFLILWVKGSPNPPNVIAPMSFEETISAECTTKTISIFAAISIYYKTTYNNNSHLP